MNIKKEDKEIVIRIPIWQKSLDALGDYRCNVHNIVGVIVHRKFGAMSFEDGIYQLNDLGYKGDIQLGMPIVMLNIEEDEIRQLCSELGIGVWEYYSCNKCGKTIWSSHTIDSEGKLICFDCEDSTK